jgi:two-component system, chemotaxis family, chemotaxis protein CheY
MSAWRGSVDVNIVAVDDSEVLLEYISLVLEDAGHRVFRSGSAVDAIHLISANSIDLVLSDVNMEGTDGFALARILRTDPTHDDIPIIFVTGTESDDFKVRVREAGANGWLKKPFKPEQLLKLAHTFEF